MIKDMSIDVLHSPILHCKCAEKIVHRFDLSKFLYNQDENQLCESILGTGFLGYNRFFFHAL